MYEGRAKLFRFDACREWKHRGIGEMKILVNRATKVKLDFELTKVDFLLF